MKKSHSISQILYGLFSVQQEVKKKQFLVLLWGEPLIKTKCVISVPKAENEKEERERAIKYAIKSVMVEKSYRLISFGEIE